MVMWFFCFCFVSVGKATRKNFRDLCCKEFCIYYVDMLRRYCWLFWSLIFAVTSFASYTVLTYASRDHETSLASVNSVTKFPFQDPKLPWDTRVNDLVSRLTLDEMVNQSIAAYGAISASIERLGVPPYLFITECLHGYVGRNATAFPQSINLAATFRLCLSVYGRLFNCDLGTLLCYFLMKRLYPMCVHVYQSTVLFTMWSCGLCQPKDCWRPLHSVKC